MSKKINTSRILYTNSMSWEEAREGLFIRIKNIQQDVSTITDDLKHVTEKLDDYMLLNVKDISEIKTTIKNFGLIAIIISSICAMITAGLSIITFIN